MPRGLAAATSSPSDRTPAALSRPSSHGPAISTACPRVGQRVEHVGAEARLGDQAARACGCAGRTSRARASSATPARRSRPAGRRRRRGAAAGTARSTGPAGRRRGCRTRRPEPSSSSSSAGLRVVRGPLAGRQAAGQPRLEPEHLRARRQREPEAGDDRARLQPAARRRRGHAVAPPVDDVDVAGVAGAEADRGDGRFADAGRGPRATPPTGLAATRGDAPVGRAGQQPLGRRRRRRAARAPPRTRRTAGCRAGRRRRRRTRPRGRRTRAWPPRPRCARASTVSLRAHEVADAERLEHRELLQEHRSLAPGGGLVHGPAGEPQRRRSAPRSPASRPGRRPAAARCARRPDESCTATPDWNASTASATKPS